MRPRKSLPQTLHRWEKVGDAKGCRGGGSGSFLPAVPVPRGGQTWESGFRLGPSPPLDPCAGGRGRVAHSAGEGTLRAIAVPFLLQRSGFGWFSWFRSKPPNKAAPSGDEDSPDSPDSEVA